jgi:hypothetical protein
VGVPAYTGQVDIGPQQAPIVIEPIESPVPGDAPAVPEPAAPAAPAPEPVPA